MLLRSELEFNTSSVALHCKIKTVLGCSCDDVNT